MDYEEIIDLNGLVNDYEDKDLYLQAMEADPRASTPGLGIKIRGNENPQASHEEDEEQQAMSEIDELKQIAMEGMEREERSGAVFGYGDASFREEDVIEEQVELDEAETVGAGQQFKQEMLRRNKQALEQLKNGLNRQCLETLKEAEARLVRRLRDEQSDRLVLKLLSVTLNNIACYYKK